jgi:hypothetical protein
VSRMTAAAVDAAAALKRNSDPCSDCTRLYMVYERQDKLPGPMKCVWCGESNITKIKHYSLIPSRFGFSDFCKDDVDDTASSSREGSIKAHLSKQTSCYAKYAHYVYSRDLAMQQYADVDTKRLYFAGFTRLKHGLPYFITKKNPNVSNEIMLKCCFCGQIADDVITNVCMPEQYEHKNFCKNNFCCTSYCKKFAKTASTSKKTMTIHH